jgi:hypothetical protein
LVVKAIESPGSVDRFAVCSVLAFVEELSDDGGEKRLLLLSTSNLYPMGGLVSSPGHAP